MTQPTWSYKGTPVVSIQSMPEGTYGRIAPRSGLAVKKGIDVLAGVAQ